MVIFNGIHLNRAEGAQPNMERDMGDGDPHPFDFLQQFFCKMQPGRRRGSGTVVLRIYRLVPVFIL